MPRSTGILCLAVGIGSLVGDLSSLSLDKGKMPTACGDAPTSSSAPPRPEELTSAEQSLAMAPSPYPFGLRNATASYAYAYASAHADPSGHRQCFALDFDTTAPTHSHADSSEEDKAWAGANFSGLHDPEAMRRFMATSDYCFGYSNSDDEGTYDPTRECFNVELGMPSDEDEGAGNRSPPRVEPPAAQNENPTPEELRCLDLEQLCEL